MQDTIKKIQDKYCKACVELNPLDKGEKKAIAGYQSNVYQAAAKAGVKGTELEDIGLGCNICLSERTQQKTK